MTIALPLNINQPPVLPAIMREIEARAGLMTNWEFGFIARMRPKITFSQTLSEYEHNTIFKVWQALQCRKTRPVEKEPDPRKVKK